MVHGMDAFKVVASQFFKDLEKSPGWIPLLVLILVVADVVHMPSSICVFGVPVSRELLASLLTLILYLLGDAIDDLVFKKRDGDEVSTRERYKKKYRTELSTAAQELEVDSHGMYALALKLSKAAEKERESIWIHVPNEAAKFLRSLIVPLALLGFYCFFRCCWITGGILLLTSAAALFVYPYLKVRHIRRLYSSAIAIAGNKEKLDRRAADGVLLFFWDGKFVEAALPHGPAAQAT